MALFALYGGVVIYLLGHVGFKWVLMHSSSVPGWCAAVLLVAVPLVAKLPALGQLGVLAALLAGLVAFESVRFAQERDELKHGEQHA